jgi:dTDP-4-dehydrorhamnose 3,5-epimerase
MGKFKFTETYIEGLFVIEPTVYEDKRGYFLETYQYKEFSDCGLDMVFVQDNQSFSVKGVLRGLHFQVNHPQGKLVRVIKGEVFDVAVDLRKNSKTFGKWFGINLSDKNNKQLYIPKGFAHGFLVLSDTAEFIYKCSDYYYPGDECGIMWNDPDLNISWPIHENQEIILSDKDKKWYSFKEFISSSLFT